MNKTFLSLAAATAALVAAPAATAATTITYGAANPGGTVTLTPAGPGSVASPISFDVSGTGTFSVVFTFNNPFDTARANGSASFNFDPDVLTFTGGNFSNGGSFAIDGVPGVGSAIQVDRFDLGMGSQTLTLFGTLNANGKPTNGNNFARVGGSITLTQLAGVVPEPTTWALFILGFGAVGGALRRRGNAVRVNKAKLTFA